MERICLTTLLIIFFVLPASAGQVSTPVTIDGITRVMAGKQPFSVRHPKLTKYGKIGAKVFMVAIQIGGNCAQLMTAFKVHG